MEFLGIERNKLLRLNKPLYGMWDSEDYWGATLGFYIRKKLGMKSLSGDLSLKIKQSMGEQSG